MPTLRNIEYRYMISMLLGLLVLVSAPTSKLHAGDALGAFSGPIRIGDRFYFSHVYHDEVFCFEASSKTLIWRKRFPNIVVRNAPVAAKGADRLLLVGSKAQSGVVWCLDMDGRPIWDANLGSQYQPGQVVPDSKKISVICLFGDGMALVQLEANTGKVLEPINEYDYICNSESGLWAAKKRSHAKGDQVIVERLSGELPADGKTESFSFPESKTPFESCHFSVGVNKNYVSFVDANAIYTFSRRSRKLIWKRPQKNLSSAVYFLKDADGGSRHMLFVHFWPSLLSLEWLDPKTGKIASKNQYTFVEGVSHIQLIGKTIWAVSDKSISRYLINATKVVAMSKKLVDIPLDDIVIEGETAIMSTHRLDKEQVKPYLIGIGKELGETWKLAIPETDQ